MKRGAASLFSYLSPVKLLLLAVLMLFQTACSTGSSLLPAVFGGSGDEGDARPFLPLPDPAARSAFVAPRPKLPGLERVEHPEVQAEYDRLRDRNGDGLQVALERARPLIFRLEAILDRHQIPSDLLIVPFIESHFRTNAVSSRGAAGLWQFTKGTGRHYGLRVGLLDDERRDPLKATRAAALHLRDLYREFNSWPLALAAYNCGGGRVRKACAGRAQCDYWSLIREKALPPQTRKYVPRIVAALLYLEDRDLWPFSFDDPFAWTVSHKQ